MAAQLLVELAHASIVDVADVMYVMDVFMVVDVTKVVDVVHVLDVVDDVSVVDVVDDAASGCGVPATGLNHGGEGAVSRAFQRRGRCSCAPGPH